MKKNIFENLEKFRKDRGLDKKEFDLETYLRKDFEEMFELMGFEREFCKKTAELKAKNMMEFWTKAKLGGMTPDYSPFNRLDALGDRIVYAVEAIEQHNYDAELVLDEVQKEINSRDGEIINGKFEKYLTPEAEEKWYKANFHNAVRA